MLLKLKKVRRVRMEHSKKPDKTDLFEFLKEFQDSMEKLTNSIKVNTKFIDDLIPWRYEMEKISKEALEKYDFESIGKIAKANADWIKNLTINMPKDTLISPSLQKEFTGIAEAASSSIGKISESIGSFGLKSTELSSLGKAVQESIPKDLYGEATLGTEKALEKFHEQMKETIGKVFNVHSEKPDKKADIRLRTSGPSDTHLIIQNVGSTTAKNLFIEHDGKRIKDFSTSKREIFTIKPNDDVDILVMPMDYHNASKLSVTWEEDDNETPFTEEVEIH